MSEPFQGIPGAATDEGSIAWEAEEIDGVPVLPAEGRILGRRTGAHAHLERRVQVRPAVQAAAVAAGGFVAGVAVVGLVSRRSGRPGLARGSAAALGRSRRRAEPAPQIMQIVSTRRLLIDVHTLGPLLPER